VGKFRADRAALGTGSRAKAEEKAAAQPLTKRRHGSRKPKSELGTPPENAQRNFAIPISSIIQWRIG
jgi:hypothetical protein